MKKLLLFSLVAVMLFGCSADDNVSSKDGQGGSLAIFALAGNYLYTVDDNTLNVFSLVNVTVPAKVNDINVGWDIETLFANDGLLYIGSRDGMYIYSLSDPESPQLISSVSHIRSCDPVVSNGTNSFVTLHSNSFCGGTANVLLVYDTTMPSNPILLHQRTLVEPKGLGLYGNYLVVCDDQIKIFNIANPAAPVLVKSINKYCFDVIIKGDTMYAIGDSSLTRYQLNPDDIQYIVMQSEILF